MDALLAETTINCQVIAIDLVSTRQRSRRSDEYQLKAPWWPPSDGGFQALNVLKMSDGRKIGVSVSAIRFVANCLSFCLQDIFSIPDTNRSEEMSKSIASMMKKVYRFDDNDILKEGTICYL